MSLEPARSQAHLFLNRVQQASVCTKCSFTCSLHANHCLGQVIDSLQSLYETAVPSCRKDSEKQFTYRIFTEVKAAED